MHFDADDQKCSIFQLGSIYLEYYFLMKYSFINLRNVPFRNIIIKIIVIRFNKHFFRYLLEEFPIIKEEIIDLDNEDLNHLIKEEYIHNYINIEGNVLTTKNDEPIDMTKKKISQVNPLTCKICKRTYSRQSDLNAHLLKHIVQVNPQKVFHCTSCSMQFLDSKSYRMHKKTHRCEPMFSRCRFCQNVFTKRHILEDHIRRCPEREKYECKSCRRQFDIPSRLRRHKCNVHIVKWRENEHGEVEIF